MFHTKAVQKVKTHSLCSVFFFPKITPLWDNVEKDCRAGQGTWRYGTCALHAGYL